jgi:hypothetical protein
MAELLLKSSLKLQNKCKTKYLTSFTLPRSHYRDTAPQSDRLDDSVLVICAINQPAICKSHKPMLTVRLLEKISLPSS